MFSGISECDGLSTADSTMTAKPIAQVTDVDHYDNQYMLFMAMAFKSVSDISAIDHVMLETCLTMHSHSKLGWYNLKHLE